MEKEEFYTAREVADRLRVNIMTIYRYINSGKLIAYKVGKDYRIKSIDYQNFLERIKKND